MKFISHARHVKISHALFCRSSRSRHTRFDCDLSSDVCSSDLKQAFVPAVLVGVNLLAVARFTKLVSPMMALRITASRGDRAALRLLEAHDPAWAKIRAAKDRKSVV